MMIIYICFDRYCVHQADDAESWTAENFMTKLEDEIAALKEIADKISVFYDKETYAFYSLIYIIHVHDYSDFYTPVVRRDILCYGVVRPSLRPWSF
jgi:hypothetical protein